MKRRVIVVGLWVIVSIVATVVILQLIHEADLRINGLTGEVSSKVYDKDNSSVELNLVLEKIKYSGRDWIVTKSITAKVKPSLEIDRVVKGQWVRIVKNNNGFWHLGKI